MDTDIVKVVCENCGKECEIKKGTYRKHIRKHIPNYCSDCSSIKKGENVSKAKKEIFKKLSSEEKQKIVNRFLNNVNNISEEKKQNKHKKQAKTMSEKYANKTQKEKEEYSNIRKQGWEKKSEKEKLEFIQKQRDIWNKKTLEEKQKQIEILHNLSEEQERIRAEKISIKHKLRYQDPEEHKRTGLLVKEAQSKMSQEAKDRMREKQLRNSQGNNRFHKKFEKSFYNSELSKYFYFDIELCISNKNIKHFWDYGIYNQNGELELVVDLDGEFFHADGYNYNGLFSHEEYDESRYLTIPENIKSCIIYENKFDESFNYLIKILKLSYNEYVKLKYDYFKNIEFPFPKYDIKDLNRSFNDLIKMDCDDKNHINNLSLNTRFGDCLIYHFHPSIFHDHYNNKLSPYEIWNNDNELMNLIKSNAILHNHLNYNKLYQSFNLINKVRFISAGRVKMIINKYLKDYDIIFNPFDKYSSIMLGSISLDKQYIGLSNNENIFNESLNLLNYLKINLNKNIKANVYYKDYIRKDIINFQYLFTSLYDDNCDNIIDNILNKYNCNIYVFIVNNTEKYKNNIIETIYNKNYYDEYIVIIEK